jgi:hypothetical protein
MYNRLSVTAVMSFPFFSGRNRMVVEFTTTYAISVYHQSRQGVQHYVIKFVSDLRQVGGFLWVLKFPPPIKLTATI